MHYDNDWVQLMLGFHWNLEGLWIFNIFVMISACKWVWIYTKTAYFSLCSLPLVLFWVSLGVRWSWISLVGIFSLQLINYWNQLLWRVKKHTLHLSFVCFCRLPCVYWGIFGFCCHESRCWSSVKLCEKVRLRGDLKKPVHILLHCI